jgi:hypothetical protein
MSPVSNVFDIVFPPPRFRFGVGETKVNRMFWNDAHQLALASTLSGNKSSLHHSSCQLAFDAGAQNCCNANRLSF